MALHGRRLIIGPATGTCAERVERYPPDQDRLGVFAPPGSVPMAASSRAALRGHRGHLRTQPTPGMLRSYLSGPTRRLAASGMLPERAGQPVKAWAHISLADLLLLDADSALQEQWTEQVRARWAARRAHAAEAGAADGAWLDGDAAAAIACDAAMAPVVTGDVNVDALEDLVRLCVELDGSAATARPGPAPRGVGRARTGRDRQGRRPAVRAGRAGVASCAAGSWGRGWAGRACRWISGTPRRSRRGSATRCCCGTGTASGPGGCNQPAGACQVHHTTHKAHGGKTSVKTSDAVKLSSCLAGLLGCGGECGGFVVVLAGGQAVVEAAEHAAEQVALGGGVPVSGIAAAVVVGAGAG